MKLLVLSAVVIGSTWGVAHAEPSREVAYPKGSIGYEALIRGDNERAVTEIMTSGLVSKHDPAKLLNLGRAYARMGRTDEAAQMFRTAMLSRENVELVLADGRVVNSKDVARQAYANLQTRMAAR
ncbi:tetratricopeptide repeat protein [Sphingorhabdus sp.]|uniref:tetratricopeptide repeat protein n=1 Tax=Sphingorhabdus sp. TaxID=1902408 RepID=UPI00391C93E2